MDISVDVKQPTAPIAHAVVRADASPSLGGGHVRRCLVLAEALREAGWHVTFAVRPGTREAVPHLARSTFAAVVIDRGAEAYGLRRRLPAGCDLLVIDHYELDASFERACRGWARRILVIDDLADRPHDCDVLLDPTPGRDESAYARLVPRNCTLLTGAEYALLDARFRRLRSDRPRTADNVRRVLVSLGTIDHAGATALVLQAMHAARLGAAVDVVVGSATPGRAEIERLAQALSPPGRILVDVDDMAALMQTADLAIGAGGVTALERCCLGLPSMLIVVAANQRGVAEGLVKAGAALLVGELSGLTAAELARSLRELVLDAERRQTMSKAARMVTDGLGAARALVRCYPPLRAKDGALVELRTAQFADADMMLAWQSSPGVRAFSRSPQAPDPIAHGQWLRQKLDDPNCIFNVVLRDRTPAGVLRLDRDPNDVYEVSILIAKESHNLGIGRACLELARRLLPCAQFRAAIKSENFASIRMFERAGYRLSEPGIWTLGVAEIVRDPAQVS
jgi:UDP-2,4-diacetamido-2,4,6-trideoxy-beta-L-altropyranose hydrolase